MGVLNYMEITWVGGTGSIRTDFYGPDGLFIPNELVVYRELDNLPYVARYLEGGLVELDRVDLSWDVTQVGHVVVFSLADGEIIYRIAALQGEELLSLEVPWTTRLVSSVVPIFAIGVVMGAVKGVIRR